MHDLIGLAILVACIAPLGFAFYWVWVRSERRDKLIQELRATPGFTPTVQYVSEQADVFLALDLGSHRVLIARPNAVPHIIAFANVIAVEIEKDRQSLIKMHRGNGVSGAAEGASALGPVGLLLSDVTGSKQSKHTLSTLTLKILTSNVDRPLEEVVFYAGPPVPSSDMAMSACVKRCEEWYARFQTILVGNAEQVGTASERID